MHISRLYAHRSKEQVVNCTYKPLLDSRLEFLDEDGGEDDGDSRKRLYRHTRR